MVELRHTAVVSLLFALGVVYPAASHAACTEGCVFQRAIPLASENNPSAVALGDLNNDGRLDIVTVTETGTNTVYVYLQAADGTFPPPVAYQYTGQGQTVVTVGNSIDTGDLNGDGRIDVVVTTNSGIRVMLQDAQGRLSTYRDYATGTNVRVRVGDFNNDRRLDVAAIGWSGGGLNIFYQNASGGFDNPVNYAVDLGGWNDLETGDLNGDGLTDIVAMSSQNNNYPGIAVLLQNPGGGFQPPAHYNLPPDSNGFTRLPNSIGVGDVTGDGRADLVATEYWSNILAVFAQNSAGTLNPPVVYSLGTSSYRPGATAVADVNQDGRGDVVVLLEYGALDVLLQKADGTLAPALVHLGNRATSTINPHALALGDLDRDGKTDAVVAKEFFFQGVDVYLGTHADLRLTFTANRDNALVQQPTRFTATIINQGPDVATQVRFAHTLPAGMVASSKLDASQGSCDDIMRTCELGAMAVGQSATIVFEAHAYNQPGSYPNTVSVNAYPSDGNSDDNIASAVTAVSHGANLRITSHYVSRPAAGEVQYTVYVANEGSIEAQDVTIMDTLPAGVAPISASWTVWGTTRSGGCQIGGSNVRCDVGALPVTDIFAGAYPVVMSVRAQVGTSDNLLNAVSVSAATGDPDSNNNLSSRLSDAQGNPINQPPVVSSGGPYTARFGASRVLDGRGTRDPEAERIAFQWDFPDGSHAYDGQARYTFGLLGAVPVTLYATDQSSGVSSETFYVNVTNAQPVASAGAPYYLYRKNAQIYFDARGSYDVDGGALQYYWDFGDGTFGSGDQAFHAYARSGEYLARVTVADGAVSTAATANAIVLNAPPVAQPGGPYNNQKNQPVYFDGSGSTDGDYDALTYRWDFGDGKNGVGVNPVYTYARGGTYTVTLVVHDGEVDSAPATTTVTVVNHAPVANGGGPYEAVKNAPVTLDGGASYDPDNDTLTYRWDFGDGTTGSGATPTHVYSKSGRYRVTLIVNDGEIDSAAYQTTVNVGNR